MSISNQITDKLNQLEAFVEGSSSGNWLLKLLAWLILFIALIVTNLMALIRWPFSAMRRKLKKSQPLTGEPIEVSSVDELNQIISKHENVLVDFWAEWCGPCLLMEPAVKQIAKTYAEDLLVVKVDVSLNSKLSKQYDVIGLPTVILYRDGEESVRQSGALTVHQLTQLVGV